MGLAETTTKTVVSAKPRDIGIVICRCHSLLLLPVSYRHLMWLETTIFIVVSGHMSKHLPSVCAWNHYKNSSFRHRQGKAFVGRRSQKEGVLLAKISRFAEAHRDISRISRFSCYNVSCLRNPYFIVFSGPHEVRSSKNALFWKTLKPGTEKRMHFSKDLEPFRRVPKSLFL